MGDKGAAEAAEVGVGHVVGHREHAYTRLPPHLHNTRTSQIWRSGHNTIHGDTSTETLEGVAYREMRRGGGGGRVGVEEDDAAGLLDAGVPRGEVDRI